MKSLVFVYNARSGAINNVLDIGHKLISPDTYSCNLCAMTHNTFSENKTWKKFREHSNLEMIFYHIDEFEQEYSNREFIYPVVLIKNNQRLTELITHSQINSIEKTEDLIEILTQKTSDLNKTNPSETTL